MVRIGDVGTDPVHQGPDQCGEPGLCPALLLRWGSGLAWLLIVGSGVKAGGSNIVLLPATQDTSTLEKTA
jgi:hypothetical protein